MLTLTQLIQQPHGYINDGLSAVCLSIEPKKSGPNSKRPGSPFWVCEFGEQTGPTKVEITFFTAPRFGIGDLVEFTGKGIKFETNQYGHKVGVGDKTVIEVRGKSAHHEDQVSRAAAGEPAVNGHAFPVAGPTAGMALKEALSLATMSYEGKGLGAALDDPKFWKSVHTIASDIIRVSHLLEVGKLADKVSVRAGVEAPAAAAEPAQKPASPPPDRSGGYNRPGQLTDRQMANQEDRPGREMKVEDTDSIPF